MENSFREIMKRNDRSQYDLFFSALVKNRGFGGVIVYRIDRKKDDVVLHASHDDQWFSFYLKRFFGLL